MTLLLQASLLLKRPIWANLHFDYHILADTCSKRREQLVIVTVTAVTGDIVFKLTSKFLGKPSSTKPDQFSENDPPSPITVVIDNVYYTFFASVGRREFVYQINLSSTHIWFSWNWTALTHLEIFWKFFSFGNFQWHRRAPEEVRSSVIKLLFLTISRFKRTLTPRPSIAKLCCVFFWKFVTNLLFININGKKLQHIFFGNDPPPI